MDSPIVKSFLAGVGALVLSVYLLDVLKGIYARFFRAGIKLTKLGSYAIVTGATDGIGEAMAFELAKKGMNIILISRSLDKLKVTADSIKEKYPKIDVKSLDIDFGKFDEGARKRVADFISGLDIGVLVNNVGMSYPFTKYFDELTDSNVDQLIKLNVDSTTWMTRIVLPGMKAKKRGAIINMASVAGVSISPLLAQYSAAKSYVVMFSKSLHYELKSQGIYVQCQVPLFVATKLAKIKKASFFVASPAQYARAAVASIGYEDVISPFWPHAFQLWLLSILPEFLVAKIVGSMHEGIRKAGMKKEAREREEGKSKEQ